MMDNICKCEFIFDESLKNLSFPPMIIGICKYCGNNKKILYSDYLNGKNTKTKEQKKEF